MNRTLMFSGVLAVIVLALLIVACGSDPEPTSARHDCAGRGASGNNSTATDGGTDA